MTTPLEESNEKITALSRLMGVGQELASSTDLDQLLKKIIKASSDVTESENASILLLDEDRNELYFRKTAGEHGEVLQKIRIEVSDHSIAGWCLLHRQSLIIPDAQSDPRHYKGVDSATAFTTRSVLATPIMWGEKCFGVVEVLNRRTGEYTQSDVEYLTILAAQAGVALNNVFVVEQLQNFFVHTVELIIAALEMVDPGSRGHVVRVARVATALARELKLPPKELEQVLYGAYFHDIGRLFNESASTGARDNNEPVLGAQLLEKIKLLEKVAPIVRYHRERFDGSGFPEGLHGDQIPLGARILGLAVEYDEEQVKTTSQHTPQHVFQEMFFENAGERHDPALLEIFRKVIFAPNARPGA